MTPSAIPEDAAMAQLLFKAIAWLEQRTKLTAKPVTEAIAFTNGTWELDDVDSYRYIRLICRTVHIDVVSCFRDGNDGPTTKLWTSERAQIDGGPIIEVQGLASWPIIEERLSRLCSTLGL